MDHERKGHRRVVTLEYMLEQAINDFLIMVDSSELDEADEEYIHQREKAIDTILFWASRDTTPDHSRVKRVFEATAVVSYVTRSISDARCLLDLQKKLAYCLGDLFETHVAFENLVALARGSEGGVSDGGDSDLSSVQSKDTHGEGEPGSIDDSSLCQTQSSGCLVSVKIDGDS